MKRFFLLLAVVGMLFTACSEVGTNEQPTPTEPEYVTVSLGINVELDYEYEPLSRADENNDLYGVQVYSTPAPATENAEWTAFAYGLFDTTDNLTIKLVRGYEYKFVATMVKDAKEKIQMNEESYLGGQVGYYCAPFNHVVSDNFTYGAEDHGLNSGSTDLDDHNLNNIYLRPNVERYYGELEGYIPGDNGGKAKIQLKRTSFGAKYIAKGDYAENGTLEILMADAPQLNLNLAESNQISEIYTFERVRDAWLDNNYSETISVLLRLVREDGSVVPFGTHNITFKRNATTVVNINTDDCGESSGVGVEFVDSGDMPEGDEITIKDGEIVDTEIETN